MNDPNHQSLLRPGPGLADDVSGRLLALEIKVDMIEKLLKEVVDALNKLERKNGVA